MEEMLGIRVPALDKFIRTNEFNAESLNENFKALFGIISGLSKCCEGSGIRFLISEQFRQIPNIKYIGSVVCNYTTNLLDVKKAYLSQDAELNGQFSNINL